MQEHKPRIKGCGQVNIFYVDILVFFLLFFRHKKILTWSRPGRDFLYASMRCINRYKEASGHPDSSQFFWPMKYSAINLFFAEDAPSKGQGQLQD
jgi:hypothetical protein